MKPFSMPAPGTFCGFYKKNAMDYTGFTD
jgi:hypothetical protein